MTGTVMLKISQEYFDSIEVQEMHRMLRNIDAMPITNPEKDLLRRSAKKRLLETASSI